MPTQYLFYVESLAEQASELTYRIKVQFVRYHSNKLFDARGIPSLAHSRARKAEATLDTIADYAVARQLIYKDMSFEALLGGFDTCRFER